MKKLESNKVFVQIGVYDGKDEFNELVHKYFPVKLILVEPNPAMNEEISKNYADITNYFIENSAIMEVTKGTVRLVHPDNNPNAQFYNQCFSLIPMDDWGRKLKHIKAPSLSFMDLCKKYDLTDINFLQIDTEGYDAQIIQSIDFSKVSIDIIKYENWPFSPTCYKRHGDKRKKYGSNGMIDVKEFLERHGYVVEEGKADIIATRIK
jgi:FkbM family methyltransferase